MKRSFIQAISHYLPTEILDNEKLNEMFPEWAVEKISGKTGIFERHISGKDEFASDMAVAAANKLFTEHNIAAESIDFILLCTQSPDYFLPTTACLVQERLNIPTRAGALDFNLGCSGYVYGLALAKGLISAGIAKRVLLLTSETYTKFIHPADKSNRTIFGDAAAATVIGADSGIAEILDFELGTDGKGAENLIVKQGGLRHPATMEEGESKTDEFGNTTGDKYLYMNGSEIFNFTSDNVPGLVNDLVKKHELTIDDIDLFVFHQANKFMLNHLRKKIRIPEEKFHLFLEHCGNTVSATIPIALENAIQEGKVKKDDKVLLSGFGVGYSWGGTILKFA